MGSPAAIFTSVAALLVAGSAGAQSGADQSRVLWQGPVLAGAAVAWAEESAGTGSLHLWSARRGNRIVYRSDSLALGRPLAASRTLLAFERSYSSCPPPAGHVCPDGADTLLGPLMGPFRTLVRPRTCFLPALGNSVALDGSVVAYVELDCTRQRLRVVAQDVGHRSRPRILRDAPITDDCCRDIAVAGKYVAWTERRDIVVYDRTARRVAYRARVRPVGIDADVDFDLQADGKLAVAFRLVEFARAGPTAIAWLSPSRPSLHLLAFRGTDTRISIAGDRIAFHRYVSEKKSALVIADLHRRRTLTVARLTQPNRIRGSFDFDGWHIAWASDRITERRVDCPPPGEGRPCVRRESGITSVWRRAVRAVSPRLIAQLRFENVFGRY